MLWIPPGEDVGLQDGKVEPILQQQWKLPRVCSGAGSIEIPNNISIAGRIAETAIEGVELQGETVRQMELDHRTNQIRAGFRSAITLQLTGGAGGAADADLERLSAHLNCYYK